MVWILLFLPLSVWLGITYVSGLNLLSIGGLGITVLVFFFIELRMALKDRARDKRPLTIMTLMVFSIVVGLLWK